MLTRAFLNRRMMPTSVCYDDGDEGGHSGEDVEHGDSCESGGRNGEKEGQQVHEWQHGPSVEEEDQNEAALLFGRDESFFVEDEEGEQNSGARNQEVDKVPEQVGQPKSDEIDARHELQVFGFRHAFLHC